MEQTMEQTTVTMNKSIIDSTKVKKSKKSKKVKSSVILAETEAVETPPMKEALPEVVETTGEVLEVPAATEKKSAASKFVEELIYIPVPRVRKYINNKRVNKTIEDLLLQIKDSQTESQQLELSDEYKCVIGKYMENRELVEAKIEAENVKLQGLGKELKVYTKLSELSEHEVALSALSKLKHKFSNNSFQVVSIILDQVVMEITELTIKNTLLSKKTTVLPVFSVKNDYASGDLYALYAKSKTYMDLLESVNSTAEVVESTEEVVESTPAVTDKLIDFKFHIRKIVNHLKHHNQDYRNIKISHKFCEFCSSVVFDILDRVISILMVLVGRVHHKTITKELFISVFEIVLVDSGVDDTVVSTLLSTVTSVMSEVQDKKSA
jgi:hypothetical protein